MHPPHASLARPSIPPPAGANERILAELKELREALAGFERRLEEMNARAALAAAERKKLDEVAAAQAGLRRRLDEIARDLAKPPLRRPGMPQRIGSLAHRLVVRASRLAGRFGAILPRAGEQGAVHPAAATAAGPAPGSWLLSGSKQHAGKRAVLAVLFGLPPEEQASLVARLTTREAAPGTFPVFVTDDSAFEPFRAHRALFEYLPQARRADDPARGRDWELYAARRFALLCDKWQPLRVVAFGPAAARQLARWSGSPHLSGEMQALLRDATTGTAAEAAGSDGRPSGTA
jgi:hypothetical protein